MAEEFFTEAFIDGLPSDPIEALIFTAAHFDGMHRQLKGRVTSYDEYAKAYLVLRSLCDATELQMPKPIPNVKSAYERVKAIVEYYRDVTENLALQALSAKMAGIQERVSLKFGRKFAYEFSEGDLSRVQILISKMREILAKSELFTAEHKERMIKRLEALQSELHKKMSSLDRFWGLIGDAGVVIGQFGKDAKPLVDCIKEIVTIVWITQARTEQLQSGYPNPLLTPGEMKE